MLKPWSAHARALARNKFPKFNSGHEGYAIIKEELDELWNEIKKSKDSRIGTLEMIREAIQIGAMALAFAVEVGENIE
jgi:hypothetical protein